MNRQRRRRAKEQNEAYQLRQLGVELHAAARAQNLEARPPGVHRVYAGWTIGLLRKVCAHVEWWHLRAMVRSPGSVVGESDCRVLTKIVHTVIFATGYPPDGPPLDPVVLSELAKMDNCQQWFWKNEQGEICECFETYIVEQST